MNQKDVEHEVLVQKLAEPEALLQYKKQYDGYAPGIIPTFFGSILVWAGNVVYGFRPSYLKFRAVEVIARVPYHSWASAVYTLLTMFYTNEKKALELSRVSQFSRLAQDNETMHVVVISQFARREARAGIIRYTIIPMLFAFFYFWSSYILYLIRPRYSLELNYLFEQHAFEQYSEFLERYGEELKNKPAEDSFLTWYGRESKNQYDFFLSVRNDEIIHRNRSIEEIERIAKK